MARTPFYGRGPGPAIARMDMNAATAPGRAYGQMFANLGKIAGDSIEKYAEGKKKKEDQKQTASFIKRALINSPETAAQFGITGDDSMTFEEAVDQGSNAIAKDPKGLEIVKGFAAMADQQRKAQQETELFNRKISQFDRAQETAEGIAKFNFTPQELPITEETPAAFLPELDPDPFTAPPTTYQGQAPAVAQLPERFQPQGEQVFDAVQSGQLSPLQGNRIMDRYQAQAMAEQKAGPTRSEDLAERKFQRDVQKEEKEEIEQNKPKPPVYQERTLLAIDDALNILNKDSFRFPVSGFLATTASEIGGTDSANLAQAITTIQSSIGFDRLKKMRDDSPTGGALGQVSERELSLLNSSLGSLSQMQGEEQLRTNLERVRTHYDNFIKSINARNSGMSADTVKNGYLALNQSNQSAPASQATLDALQKARQLRSDRTMMQQTLDNPSIPNYGPQ